MKFAGVFWDFEEFWVQGNSKGTGTTSFGARQQRFSKARFWKRLKFVEATPFGQGTVTF